MALTVTRDLVLPATVTGSWPRPRWFDMSMWGKPLDTCMLDVRFREKFEDALAVVISDEERAGLDILTHGDFHCDEDFAGRSWHHYPLQRWAGFEGDLLQSEATRSPWLRYPPGTLLNVRVPPIISQSVRLITSPNPEPLRADWVLLLAWVKGLNRRR